MAENKPTLDPQIEKQLVEAIGKRDLASAKPLISQLANVDLPMPSQHGQTPLELARDRGCNEIVVELLKAGANWRKADIDLNWAAYFDDEWLTKLLIDGQAGVNESSYLGTPLEQAAKRGSLNIARMLILARADVNAGALEEAVKANQTEMVRLLLKSRAKPQRKSKLVATAAEHANAEMVDLLIDAGADVNERATFADWTQSQPPADQWCDPKRLSHATPLIIAVARKSKPIVESLVRAKANLYIADAYGHSAMDWARGLGLDDIVAVLTAAIAASPKVLQPDEELLLAAETGDLERVKTMLAAKANVDERDKRPLRGGLTPLMLAAREGHAAIAAALLDAGADLTLKDNLDSNTSEAGFNMMLNEMGVEFAASQGFQLHRTALHWAAAAGHAEVAKILLERGAEFSAKDRSRMTPIMLAAESGSAPILSDLISRGVDVNERGPYKNTPLMFAAEKGHIEAMRVLIAAGTKIDIKNNDGLTALIFAAKRAKPDALAILLEAGANPFLASRRDDSALTMICGSNQYNLKRENGEIVLQHRRPKEDVLACAKLLLKAGANPHTKLGKMSAIDEAQRGAKYSQFYKELVELLQSTEPVAIAPPPAKPKAAKKKPKKRESSETIAVPDFTQAATSKEFLAALEDLETLCGSKCMPMPGVNGGFAIHIHSDKGKSFSLETQHPAFLKRGCLIFQNQSQANSSLGVLPTSDPFDAIRAMQTNGVNEGVMPADLIKFLQELSADHPFILTSAGHDFCGGQFTSPIRGAVKLVKRLAGICSDVLDCVEPSAVATDLTKTRRFFLWWD